MVWEKYLPAINIQETHDSIPKVYKKKKGQSN